MKDHKFLTLAPNGKGGVKIYAPLNLSNKEKVDLLEQALKVMKGKNK
jgi:hypothetical protein